MWLVCLLYEKYYYFLCALCIPFPLFSFGVLVINFVSLLHYDCHDAFYLDVLVSLIDQPCFSDLLELQIEFGGRFTFTLFQEVFLL